MKLPTKTAIVTLTLYCIFLAVEVLRWANCIHSGLPQGAFWNCQTEIQTAWLLPFSFLLLLPLEVLPWFHSTWVAFDVLFTLSFVINTLGVFATGIALGSVLEKVLDFLRPR